MSELGAAIGSWGCRDSDAGLALAGGAGQAAATGGQCCTTIQ